MEARLIVGCGYLGGRVGTRWLDEGHAVTVLTRSQEKASQLEQLGYQTHLGDLSSGRGLPDQFSAERVLFAVGFDRQGDVAVDEVFVSGLKNILDRFKVLPKSFVYISSTGVFGDTEDDWVDESSPCQPKRPSAKASLACEQLLTEHPIGAQAIVLRLAGIYGPDRIPNVAALRAGQPIRGFETGYLNLIHVDDAACVVDAVLEQEGPDRFLVSDGQPVLRRDYYSKLAKLVGAPEPKIVAPDQGTPKAARGNASKRISNAKLRESINFRPKYPDYQTGLEAIVRAADNSE